MNEKSIIEKSKKIYVNDLSSYQISFNDDRDKYLKMYRFEDGTECAIYYPPNIDSNTKMVTYYSGQGEKSDWRGSSAWGGSLGIQDYIKENGSDKIIIMPTGSFASREVLSAKLAINFEEKYNLNDTSHMWSGWSMGGNSCIYSPATYQILKKNPKPQVVVEVDGNSYFSTAPNSVIGALGNSFKQNNNILISIQSKTDPKATAYAKAGFNTIKAVYTGGGKCDVRNGDGSIGSSILADHNAINQQFLKTGFMDFGTGKGKLPTENFEYYTWNGSDWERIDVSQIDTYEKLMGHFGIQHTPVFSSQILSSVTITKLKGMQLLTSNDVRSEAAPLLNGVNAIISTIKGSSFLQDGYKASGFSSTTLVPSAIPSTVINYFTQTAELLDKVVNQVKIFVSIKEGLDDFDKEKSDQAEELNNEESDTEQNTETPPNTETPSETENNPQTENPPKKDPVIIPGVGGGDGGETPEDEIKPEDEKVSETIEEESTIAYDKYQNLSYENYTTNKDMLVYQYGDNCKIVIHKNGDKVIGIEHCFDLSKTQDIDGTINNLNKYYNSIDFSSTSFFNDKTIKYRFQMDSNKIMNINTIQEKYSKLQLV